MTTVPIFLGFNGSTYQVTRSLRFRSSASAYLNRTPTVAGNRQIWTWNAWLKRGGVGSTDYCLFAAGTSATDVTDISFSANSPGNVLYIRNRIASTNQFLLQTTPVYRDPSAWYMITVVFDTTQATSSDRCKIYVNGVQVTAFSTATYGAQNSNTYVNATNTHNIATQIPAAAYFDGYLAEVNFVDGQALTPSSFGYFDLYGVWQPKRYNGTYGTNGFYLPFSNTTSTTTLVADSSGNGNNWTANNISLTAGSTYDSMIDSPTPYADGSTNRGSYAVLNPLDSDTAPSDGNLRFVTTTSQTCTSTIKFPTSGKWYCEVTVTSSGGAGLNYIGIFASKWASYTGYSYASDGTKYSNSGGSAAYGASYTTGDVIGIAVDVTGGTLTFYKNNVSQGTAYTGLSTATLSTLSFGYSSGSATGRTMNFNFGQQPFTYALPTGFTALNTFNLPAPSVPYGAPYMNAITYTGYGPLVPSGLGILPKRNASTQNVSKSLRFRQSASAYLNRTYGTPTSATTGTISIWYKRGLIGSSALITAFGTVSTTTGNGQYIQFNADKLRFIDNASDITSTALFNDPSAWYHVVVAIDTTQATASNRVKMYVNGTQITAFSSTTYGAQNYSSSILASGTQYIGYSQPSNARGSDGYLAETYFVDGQALTPSSFGQTNSDGIWVPKAYTGTYGTNGFYLPFTNTTSTTTLVADASGNGNNWTPNNISLTAGTTYDSMTDSPTDYASAGNYATMNPLDIGSSGAPTITQANLNVATPVSGFGNSRSTIGVSSGKWYWEVTAVSATNNVYMIGVSNSSATMTNYFGSDANGWGYFGNNGQKYNSGSGTAYGATYTANDVIGVALDMNAGTLTFYKNGTSQGTAFTGLTGTLFPAISDGNGTTDSATMNVNFGQRPFSYSAPSGYSTLNTYNLTAPSTTWFSSANNSGNASATAYPDLVWIKSRSSAQSHSWNDTVRGPTLNLVSNTTAAEVGASTMFSVNKYGLTLGNDASVNSASATDVMWGWQGGQGTTSTNTNGTITSTVSASTTSGFSIVTYTGTGTGSPTVGHGLGVAPSMIIVKSRSNAVNWGVGHVSAGWANAALLNGTNAFGGSTYFASTAPTTTVFSVQDATVTNISGATYVAYCFAAITGYSAFGSYTGNGSADGPFVYTGFRPRFILFKQSSAAGQSWQIEDTSREPYNSSTRSVLFPDLSNAEITDSFPTDFLSNGFKIRNAGGGNNASGATYIYAAFAENPFNMSRAR